MQKNFYDYTKEDYQRLFNLLKNKGAIIVIFAPTYKNGDFIKYIYFTFEYNGGYYQFNNPLNMFEDCTITKYIKINALEKQQATYPHSINNASDLINFIEENKNYYNLIPNTHKQRLLIDLWTFEKNGNTILQNLKNSENTTIKNIMQNLDSIETIKNTKESNIIRFYEKNGNYFDFELKTKQILNIGGK